MFILIFTRASSLQVNSEQMNEGEESIPSTEVRKKRRASGFRYSSKKDLDRSRVKRLAAKARGIKLDTVTKALSYPGTQSSGSVGGSGGPHCLDVLVEDDGGRKELLEGENTFQVSNFQIKFIYCLSRLELVIL
jgi:DNA-binding transcriptional MerR regulator